MIQQLPTDFATNNIFSFSKKIHYVKKAMKFKKNLYFLLIFGFAIKKSLLLTVLIKHCLFIDFVRINEDRHASRRHQNYFCAHVMFDIRPFLDYNFRVFLFFIVFIRNSLEITLILIQTRNA